MLIFLFQILNAPLPICPVVADTEELNSPQPFVVFARTWNKAKTYYIKLLICDEITQMVEWSAKWELS